MQEAASKRISAVVFDMDGLMVNTEDVFHRACTAALSERGLQLPVHVHRQMIGRRTPEAFQILVEHLGELVSSLPNPVDQLIAESHAVFDGMLPTHMQTMPGLFELLAVVRARSLPRGLATSSSRPYMERVLTQIDLISEFELTLTGDDVQQGKPHPEIYLKAAMRLGVEPSRMLVLEDSEAGTRAAAAAGAVVISIPHAHTRHQDFSAATAVAARLDSPVVLRLLEE
jgi:HAD superfamily hydrolase (TIGR01509 family)